MPGGPADPSTGYDTVSGPAVRYRTLTRNLAASTAAAVLALWRQQSDWFDTGAVLIAGANEKAASLADLFLAHLLQTSPLGLSANPDTARLAQALKTAASDEGTNPADALFRLGRSEPLAASQTSLQTGMRAHRVSGWTRQTGGASCQMCADLANGAVMSIDTEMITHPGCSCVAAPVTE